MKIPKGGGQLSLVAFFGKKAQAYPQLWAIVQEAQRRIDGYLKEGFEPYDENRVHGTIIGLEGVRADACVLNENFCTKLKKFRRMDLTGLLAFLRTDNSWLPIPLKLGGYPYGSPFPFTSRDMHPYLRSFSIQGENIVAMAWPCESGEFPSSLERLRRACNEFGVLHKYHEAPDAIDNDFFFVLGNIKGTPNDDLLRACQHDLRQFLASQTSPDIVLTAKDMQVVAYPKGDTKLKKAEAFSLEEAERRLPALLDVYPVVG